eukprot:Hpha_TRINITY_DN10602_c0_g2::TRINITY_DN10602_c0_g2_i1::g.156895::m.156895
MTGSRGPSPLDESPGGLCAVLRDLDLRMQSPPTGPTTAGLGGGLGMGSFEDGFGLGTGWGEPPQEDPFGSVPPLAFALGGGSSFAPFLPTGPSAGIWGPTESCPPDESKRVPPVLEEEDDEVSGTASAFWQVQSSGPMFAFDPPPLEGASPPLDDASPPRQCGSDEVFRSLAAAAVKSGTGLRELLIAPDFLEKVQVCAPGLTEVMEKTDPSAVASGLKKALSGPAPAGALAVAASLAARCSTKPGEGEGEPTGAWGSCGDNLREKIVDDVLPAATRAVEASTSTAEECGLLLLLCHFSATSELSIAVVYDLRCGAPAKRSRDEACGVVDLAATCLGRFPGSRPLLVAATLLLSHFACYNTRRAPAAVMQGLLYFSSDAECVARCSLTLAALCGRQGIPVAAAPTAAQSVLTPYTPDVARMLGRAGEPDAVTALMVLAARLSEGNSEAAASLLLTGAMEPVLAAARAHKDRPAVIFAACGIAERLSSCGAEPDPVAAVAPLGAAALAAAAESPDGGGPCLFSAAAAVRCVVRAARDGIPLNMGRGDGDDEPGVAAALRSLRDDAARVCQELQGHPDGDEAAEEIEFNLPMTDPEGIAPRAAAAVAAALWSRNGLLHGDLDLAREGTGVLRKVVEGGGLQNTEVASALCAAVAAHTTDEEVLHNALSGLCAVITASDSPQAKPSHQRVAVAAVSTVCTAATHLIRSASEAEALPLIHKTLLALRKVTSLPPSRPQQPQDDDENTVRIAASGGVEVCIAAMKSFPNDHSLQLAACSLLRRLCKLAQAADEAGKIGGAVVCSAAVAAAANAQVQTETEAALLREALGSLALIARGPDLGAAVVAGRDVMIAATSAPSVMPPTERKEAIRAVVAAMGRRPDDSDTQRFGCAALAGLSSAGYHQKGASGAPEHAPAHAVAPAAEATVRAMAKCLHSPEVQQEGCRALGALASWGPQAKHELVAQMAIDSVVTAARKFTHDVALQLEVCCSLTQLSYDSASLTHEITLKGGVEVCLAAMRSLSNNLRVVLAACSALSGLAFSNALGQDEILRLGGVETIVHAMKACDRPRMLESGCLVLGTLSWHDGIKAEVAGQGGIEVILDAMRKYPDHSAMQKNGCRAVSQLAYNSEANRDRLCEAGGVEAIVVAMRGHPHNDKLLLNAVVALTYLSWRSDAVVRVMAKAGGAQAVEEVASSFRDNEKLRRKAEHLRSIILRRSRSESPHHRHRNDSDASERDTPPGGDDCDEELTRPGGSPLNPGPGGMSNYGGADPGTFGKNPGSYDRFTSNWRSNHRREGGRWERVDRDRGEREYREYRDHRDYRDRDGEWGERSSGGNSPPQQHNGSFERRGGTDHPRRGPFVPAWAREGRFGDGAGLSSLRKDTKDNGGGGGIRWGRRPPQNGQQQQNSSLERRPRPVR